MKSDLMKTFLILLSTFYGTATSYAATWVDHGNYATNVESQTDWLKISQTMNMTYAEVSAGYLTNGWLITGGTGLFDALATDSATDVNAFINAVGSTGFINGVAVLKGFCCDDVFLNSGVLLGSNTYVILTSGSGFFGNHEHVSSDVAYPDIGFLLYRPTVAVPEPETYAMMLVGLGLVGGVVSRRRLMQGIGAAE